MAVARYAEMVVLPQTKKIVLILDTCSERASVALVRGEGSLVAEHLLEARAASASLLGAVRTLLSEAGRGVADLAGVGVVHGPGSFTGVRVGLAFAKGFCEVADLPLAAVSRLKVLAEADGTAGAAAVMAGRDQVYLRLQQGEGASERLMRDEDLFTLLGGDLIVVDSRELASRLAPFGPVRWVERTAQHAAGAVLEDLACGGSDLATLDANYVRDESTIYPKAARDRDPQSPAASLRSA